MKHSLVTLIIICAFIECNAQRLRATVSRSDSTIWLTANIRQDYRIFGYSRPDTNSKKMILLSVFTSDVKGNPFNCPFGSYYQTSDMEKMKIKFVSKIGKYLKAIIIKNDSAEAVIYIQKKYVEFER